MLVSNVHPVIILNAVFCIFYKLVFVSVAIAIGRRTRVWLLLWLCMLRVSFPFVSPCCCVVYMYYVCLLYVRFVLRVLEV